MATRNFVPRADGEGSIGTSAKKWGAMYVASPEASANDKRVANTEWTRALLAGKLYNNAAAHNSIYRGKDLTSYFNSGDMSTAIAAGTFDDIYIGDYITKTVNIAAKTYTNKAGTSVTRAAETHTNLKWLVAGLDSHLHSGATETTAHHVVLIPEKVPTVNVAMNPTNDTTGGFTGSDMWTQILPLWATGVQSAFGSSHVLSHHEYLSKAISATAASAAGAGFVGSTNNWEDKEVIVNIPNEPMVYGCTVFSSSGYDVGDWPRQLPLFALTGVHQTTREWFWLRAVASSTYFCDAHYAGGASYTGASIASASGGLRPYFLLR